MQYDNFELMNHRAQIRVESVGDARHILDANVRAGSSIDAERHAIVMHVASRIQAVLRGQASVDSLVFNGEHASYISANLEKYSQSQMDTREAGSVQEHGIPQQETRFSLQAVLLSSDLLAS
jgi:hypothetical protein